MGSASLGLPGKLTVGRALCRDRGLDGGGGSLTLTQQGWLLTAGAAPKQVPGGRELGSPWKDTVPLRVLAPLWKHSLLLRLEEFLVKIDTNTLLKD